MGNIIRVVALLQLFFCFSVANATDSFLRWEDGSVSITIDDRVVPKTPNSTGFDETFSILVSSNEKKIQCRGADGLFKRNEIYYLRYDLRWQYRVENGSWIDLNKYSGTWEAGKLNPDGWSGELKYTDDWTYPVIKGYTKKHDIKIEDFKNKATVNVDFRFVWDLFMHVEGDGNDRAMKGESSYRSTTLYRCSGGYIGMAEKTTIPAITENNYAIYDSEDYKRTHFIQMENTSEIIADLESSPYVRDETEINKITPTNEFPYKTGSISVLDFEKENSLTAEEFYSIRRKYYTQEKNTLCYSNKIYFEHYEPISLVKPINFESNKNQYLCASSNTSSVKLEGCLAVISSKYYDKSDYGLTYSWEYSLDGRSWIDIPDEKEMNINVTGKFFSIYGNGGSIYFRPKVYLSTFDYDIYPKDNVVYEIIPYAKPTASNLKLEISDKTVCADNEFDEGHGIITLKQKNKNEVFNPNITYTIEPSAERFNNVNPNDYELAKWRITDRLSENTTYTVTIEDQVCETNAVDYQTTLKVEKVVADPEEEITLEGCNYEFEDGTLHIQVRKDAHIIWGVKSKTNYKYILNDNMGNLMDLPLRMGTTSLNKTNNMTLQKVNKGINSIGCIGDPIPVVIEVVEDISGNEIWFEDKSNVKDNTYYLCKGEKNPIIAGTGANSIAGGYGEQTIVWRFKNTGKQIPGSDREEYSLSAGLFDVTEDCEVVRVIKMGNGTFENVSNPLKIKVYSVPTFNMTMNGSILSDGYICYEEMPIFNISYLSEEPNAKDHVGQTSYNIKTYKDVDNQKTKVDTLITGTSKFQGWKFIYDATVSAIQEFCGTSVNSANSISLSVKEDLTFKDADFAYDCPMLGKTLDITPKIDDSSTYSYKIGGITVNTGKVGTSCIKLPSQLDDVESKSINIEITRTFDGCYKKQTIKIKNVLTPLQDRQLSLKENSLSSENNLVCISKNYKIEDNDTEEADVKYSWSSKTTGATIQNGLSKDINVLLLNGNEFYRKRVLGDNCEVKTDTIKIDVLEKSTSVPTISASAKEICYGEEIEVNVDPIAGYNITSWKKNGEDQSYTSNTIKEFVKSTGDIDYEVEMTSEKCDNYTLSNKYSVTVAPNLKIKDEDITISPSDISPSLFDEKTKVVTVTLTDTKNLGQISDAFSFNGSDYKETKVSSGKFAVNFSLEEDELEDDVDMLEGAVYRTYKLSSTKTCVSDTFSLNIAPNKGFDAISINAEGDNLKAGEIFYFCDEGLLQLENSEIIFNGTILETNKYKMQWYRKTSSGVWFALTGDTKAEVVISTKGLENRSDFYKLVVSTTIDGKVYKQSSNVIEVRNVEKPNFNIRLADGDMNFCYAGAVEFELETNTWSNPDDVIDAKNTYFWQKSYDGKEWIDLKSVTTDDLIVSIAQNNNISTLRFVESAMTKGTYFRSVMTDLCGETTTSNILLTKTHKAMDLTAKDVNIMSNKLVQNTDLYDVNFFVNYSDDKIYTYTYYNEDGQIIESNGSSSQKFTYDALNGNSHDNFDYSFGKHKVYIEKVMLNNGCKSDKVVVDYEIIEPLKTDIQMSLSNTCPKADDQSGNINIVYKSGGLPEKGMTATWYYRFDNQEYFKKVDETVIDFKYNMMPNDQGNIENGRIYNINGIEHTCYFFAEISNEGYPIKSVKTSTVILEINPKFEIAKATCDKSQYCYGEGVELKAGDVKSSYGDVSYRWINLNDNKIYPTTDILELDAIYDQTTFRRIATDGCGIKDTFDISLAVREKLEMSTDEYEHASYSEKGKIPYIAVKDLLHVSSYMVSHINQDGVKDVKEEKAFGVTDYSFGTMPAVAYDTEKYEIYKTDKIGCKSVADTFIIKGIEEISAGRIAFESYDSKAIDICHGEKIGKIVDEKVANGGTNITYQWYYIEKGEREKVLDDKGLPVNTAVFNADTMKFGTNIATNNEKGNKIKTYAIFRQASMNVMQSDGVYTPYVKYSDTLYVNVAPQLINSNIEKLAGSIKAQTNSYCGGVERSGTIVLTTEDDIVERYETKDFGALMFEDHDLFGYWEASKGNKKNYVQVSDAVPYEDFESKFYLDELDTTTYVRFTITDGCSTTSTTEIALSVMTFDKDNSDNYTIDRQAIDEKYIEEGDKIKVTNFENMDNEWYSSKNEKGLIGTDYYIILDSVTFATRLYHKRINEKNNITCVESDYFEVPLKVHPTSHGGRISSNQCICPDGEFADLKNYESAFGGTEEFKYRWEITTDTSEACSCWNEIQGAFEDTLNYATYRRELDSRKTNFIRRSATPIYNGKEVVDANAKYTRYSNVISLEKYKQMKVSELSWKEAGAKTAYCAEENVPVIITESPTGGSAEYKNTSYSLNWMYSVDGTNWHEYRNTSIAFGGTSEVYGSGIVYSYFEDKQRNQDVTFYVKAVFTDAECGVIESDPFSFIVWAKTQDPELYIESDSCNSRFISFAVENKTDYLYKWAAITDTANPLQTDFDTKYKMDFDKNPAYIVSEYYVQGKHVISGCKTSVIFFDIDSLPSLQQNSVPTQTSLLCFGSDLNIELSTATGGTGIKSYLWQYSYDNEKWNDANTGKDFFYEDVRSDMFVRRLVFTDICKDTITSEPVLYKVADKIEPISVSIEENLCKNQDMIITLTDSIVDNFNVVVYRLEKDTIKEVELTLENPKGRIKGNDLSENIFGIITWDSTYTCKSEMVKKTILPRPDFSGVESTILSDAESVCEGSSITISSTTDYSLPEFLKQRIEISKDTKTWSVIKEDNEYQTINKIIVNDTAYYRAILSNGCKDSIISNYVKVGGKKNIDNPMTFDVETSSDGVIIVGNNNTDMATLALIVNDSIDYDFKDKISLTKETEKVFVTSKIGTDGNMICYSPVIISPLKEGQIFTECLSTGKTIIGEDVVNAPESDVTYKWYKFANDSLMYFTDVTSKNFELTIDEEKSKMLRVAYYNTDNIKYTLKSNVLTVSANGPSISRISPLEKDSLIKQNLKINDFYMTLNIGMTVTLNCFIDDAESGEWQSSEDGETWITAYKFDSTHLDSQTLEITPVNPVYYRVVAKNACGTTSTDSIYVAVATISPITEGCIETELNDCEKSAKIICYDDESKNYRKDYYEYYFEILGEYLNKEEEGENGIKITGIDGTVDVIITKSYKGVSTKYIKKIDMSQAVGSSFSIIAEGVEYGSPDSKGEWLDSVQVTRTAEVASGTKIQLKNRSDNGKSYRWEVYYDGIKMATSLVESPLLYVYNEGVYSFILTSFSGKCESNAIWESGVSVQSGTLRSYNFDDENVDFAIEKAYKEIMKPKMNITSIEVYPTVFTSELHIDCIGIFNYSIFNEIGIEIANGSATDNVIISTIQIPSGSYIIKVNDIAIKVIKK